MSDENGNINQTDFSAQAPMMDGGEAKTTAAPKPEEVKVEAAKRPIQKPIPLPIMIGIITIVVLVFVTVGTYLMPKEGTNTQTTGPQASATPVTTSNLPPDLQKAIDSLSADVKEADPQSNDLPFPPVNFQLHLVSAQAKQ